MTKKQIYSDLSPKHTFSFAFAGDKEALGTVEQQDTFKPISLYIARVVPGSQGYLIKLRNRLAKNGVGSAMVEKGNVPEIIDHTGDMHSEVLKITVPTENTREAYINGISGIFAKLNEADPENSFYSPQALAAINNELAPARKKAITPEKFTATARDSSRVRE